MEQAQLKDILEFLTLVNNLKHMKRTGWVYRDVANPESVASHMYSMGVMTFLIANEPSLDRFRCLQLALVHDLAECIVGDISPCDNIPKEVKHAMERKAIEELVTQLPTQVGSLIRAVHIEYETQETPEAKFVKDLDLFDMILTAAQYERDENNYGRLQDFFDSTRGKFKHPLVRDLVNQVIDDRSNNTASTANC